MAALGRERYEEFNRINTESSLNTAVYIPLDSELNFCKVSAPALRRYSSSKKASSFGKTNLKSKGDGVALIFGLN